MPFCRGRNFGTKLDTNWTRLNTSLVYWTTSWRNAVLSSYIVNDDLISNDPILFQGGNLKLPHPIIFG